MSSASDIGFDFYGGLGAGVRKTFNGKLFINFEYELAYLRNNSYSDGFMYSFILGHGVIL